MKGPTEQALEVSNKIMESVISQFQVEGNLNQMKIQIHPIISNAMFHRDNEILEAERFRTLQQLSRVLSDKAMKKAIKSLGFHLNL